MSAGDSEAAVSDIRSVFAWNTTPRGMYKISPGVRQVYNKPNATLNNAFVILDEAQNATNTQMKMFLTRIGFNSRAIITGDVTQTDLPRKHESGLISIQRILKDIEGIDFVYLDDGDVVRHKLVKDIINAYDKYVLEEPGPTNVKQNSSKKSND